LSNSSKSVTNSRFQAHPNYKTIYFFQPAAILRLWSHFPPNIF